MVNVEYRMCKIVRRGPTPELSPEDQEVFNECLAELLAGHLMGQAFVALTDVEMRRAMWDASAKALGLVEG